MTVTGAAGFAANGIACGIKPSGDLDLSLVATSDGRPVAAAGAMVAGRASAPSAGELSEL